MVVAACGRSVGSRQRWSLERREDHRVRRLFTQRFVGDGEAWLLPGTCSTDATSQLDLTETETNMPSKHDAATIPGASCIWKRHPVKQSMGIVKGGVERYIMGKASISYQYPRSRRHLK